MDESHNVCKLRWLISHCISLSTT